MIYSSHDLTHIHVVVIKHKYMLWFMMISGPIQPRNDIDVYLNSLIEDLRVL